MSYLHILSHTYLHFNLIKTRFSDTNTITVTINIHRKRKKYTNIFTLNTHLGKSRYFSNIHKFCIITQKKKYLFIIDNERRGHPILSYIFLFIKKNMGKNEKKLNLKKIRKIKTFSKIRSYYQTQK